MEIEYCKKNRLCFACKSEGKEVMGSIHYHPNHLKPNTTTARNAATDSKPHHDKKKGKDPSADTQVDSGSDSDTDSDSDKKQSKN